MDLFDQDCFLAALLMQCKSGSHTFLYRVADKDWKDWKKVVGDLSVSEKLGLDQDD